MKKITMFLCLFFLVSCSAKQTPTTEKQINTDAMACKAGVYYYFISYSSQNESQYKYNVIRIDSSGKKKTILSQSAPIYRLQSVDDETICIKMEYDINRSGKYTNGNYLLDLNKNKISRLSLKNEKSMGESYMPCWVGQNIIYPSVKSSFIELWIKNHSGEYKRIVEKVNEYYIYDNKLHFYYNGGKESQENSQLGTCNLDGSNLEVVEGKDNFYRYDDYEFIFRQNSFDIKNVKTDEIININSEMDGSGNYYFGCYVNGLLFCNKYSGPEMTLNAINPINGEEKIIHDNVGHNFAVIDDWVFFSSPEENAIYRMKNDGAALEKLS